MRHFTLRPATGNIMDENSKSEGFFLASILLDALETLYTRGIDAETTDRALDLNLRSLLADPNARIPTHLLGAILYKTLQLYPNPLSGLHTSQPPHDSAFGALGYLGQTYTTLQETFTTKTRYERLVSNIGITSMRQEPGMTLYCWSYNTCDPLFVRHAIESLLGQWLWHVHSIREQKHGLLLHVHFRYSSPKQPNLLAEYERTFGCPILFDQPESALVIPITAMGLHLRTPDLGLQATLQHHAGLLLNEHNDVPPLLNQVRPRMRVLLMEDSVSRDHPAEELGINSRHLHRQLQKVGSSYRELVDDIRIELAKTLLHDDALTVEAISRRPNFREGPSFNRQFREMTQRTSDEYRRQLHTPEASIAPQAPLCRGGTASPAIRDRTFRLND